MGFDSNGVPITGLSIFSRLETYARGFSRKCPTDTFRDFSARMANGATMTMIVPSYAYNIFVGGWTGNGLLFRPIHEAQVNDPSSLILMADGTYGFRGLIPFGFCIQHPYPDNGSYRRDAYGAPIDSAPFPAYSRHNQGAVYTYFDGHSKWRPATDATIWGTGPYNPPPAWNPRG